MPTELLQPASSAVREVVVRVPAPLEPQLVFRADFRGPLEVDPPTGLSFVFCRGPLSYLGAARRLGPLFSPAETVKNLLKVGTTRRMFYFARDEQEILHFGWLTTGRCRQYRIERDAVGIGPIWTAAAARGRGLATFATKMAINELLRAGHHIFYIDTSMRNLPCLRVIERCGFGEPMATYVRGDSIPSHHDFRAEPVRPSPRRKVGGPKISFDHFLRNRVTRAVKRRLFGSATLDVTAEIERRGVELRHLDALEVFGGTGELHTVDYASRVRSLTVWEINPELESRLRRNLPQAEIKITNSLEEVRATDKKFHFVVIDNALFVNESSLCEHFDFFPALFRILAERAVLVINVMPEASPEFRAKYEVFHPYHLQKRAEFYGSRSPEKISVAEMVQTYRSLAEKAGFQLDWYFSKKRGKNVDVHFLVLALRREPVGAERTA